MSKLPPIKLVVLSLGLSVLVGCSTTAQQGSPDRQTVGAVIGAVAGAVIGGNLDDTRGNEQGVVLGAVIGGTVGGLIGGKLDDQEQEFNEALEQERISNHVEIERVREDLLKLTLNNEVSFDTDSSAIKPAFVSTLDKLSGVLAKHNQSNILVVGHTDSVGSYEYNEALSFRRASSVSDFLEARAVSPQRIEISGKGEIEPRDSNLTEAGRQLNRRVEIYVQPYS